MVSLGLGEIHSTDRLRTDHVRRIESRIALGSAVASGAFGREGRRATRGSRLVDCPRIFRRADVLADFSLARNQREIEVAVVPPQWRAKSERREQIAANGRLRVA